jgi:hypothetical protein
MTPLLLNLAELTQGCPGLTPVYGAALAEVSGIRTGRSSQIRARLEQKKRQTRRSDGAFPAYVIVVEFGSPLATLVQR